MAHLWSRVAALMVIGLLPAVAAVAQEGTGVVRIVDWPASVMEAGQDLEPFTDVDVLPFLDTLTLEYRYLVQDGRPALTFALSWVPGDEGVLGGERLPLEELPQDLRLIALDARADVFVEGVRADELIVSVDSLALSPAPYVYPFEAVGFDWDTVFEEAGAGRARAYFEAGFELRNLRVLRIAFASYDDEGAGRRVAVTPRPRPPARTGIYVPDPDVWIIISGGTRRRPPPIISDLPERPRGDSMGRGRVGSSRRPREGARGDEGVAEAVPDEDASDREARGERTGDAGEALARGARRAGGKKDGDDEDDDDDTDLLPAAVVGAAAVGLIAFAGGTIGYYGDVERAPIGLGSGFIQPKWGMLIRVAVNRAVLGAGDGPERLAGNLFGFYRVFDAPVQPALGVGVWAEEHDDDIEVTPSLSVGAVGLFGPVLLQGGYDVGEGSVQLGLAFNFRYRR